MYSYVYVRRSQQMYKGIYINFLNKYYFCICTWMNYLCIYATVLVSVFGLCFVVHTNNSWYIYLEFQINYRNRCSNMGVQKMVVLGKYYILDSLPQHWPSDWLMTALLRQTQSIIWCMDSLIWPKDVSDQDKYEVGFEIWYDF